MSRDKKLIYFLVVLIIFFGIILIIKINITPKYNQKIYDEIYAEYEYTFGEIEDNYIQENSSNSTQESHNVTNNNDYISNVDYGISSNTGNVIGKIIIPKIDIMYPIIKETTEEYLKVAPTKYCGPEVNEIRKFSYSWS